MYWKLGGGGSAILRIADVAARFPYAATRVSHVGAQACCVPLKGATSLRQGYGTAGKIAPLRLVAAEPL